MKEEYVTSNSMLFFKLSILIDKTLLENFFLKKLTSLNNLIY